ncbi:3-hydroxy-2-methylbutyryl-CoA dehydrogenase [Devosia sp. 17-2-E-8]|nr:3-hydroxy-2-methylbutyryl-CoA dehydrogenase [Devosia sp. 17-2-E-8]
MEIAENVALVTGGGSGLGAATALALAAAGAHVGIFDRDGERAAAIAAQCGGLALAGSVTSRDDAEAAVAKLAARYGSAPRILVNCAGIGTAARILPKNGSLTIDSFEKTVATNLTGTFIMLSVAARAMSALDPVNADGETGIIINTASVAYQDGQVGQAAYAASKGGIAAMTLPAARELARFGIRVATIAPGLFETSMTGGLPEEARQGVIQMLPFPRRLGAPEEYAATVAHIISNPMINGTVIRLDGAVRLPPR